MPVGFVVWQALRTIAVVKIAIDVKNLIIMIYGVVVVLESFVAFLFFPFAFFCCAFAQPFRLFACAADR